MSLPPKITNEYMSKRKDAIAIMSSILDTVDREICLIITLSSDYRIINKHIISVGDFYETKIYPQVIFQRAIVDKSKYFFLGHNHTDGTGYPSEDDIIVIMELLLIGDILDIMLLDSIIFPYGKNPACIRSVYPKLWKKDYCDKVLELLKNNVPRKVKGS